MSIKFIGYFGWLVLLHAAYSANHYRSLVKLIGSEVTADQFLPHDIIIELAIALLLILIGIVAPLKLRRIFLTSNVQSKSFPEAFARSDFMVFNHRGKHLKSRIERAKASRP